MVAVPAVIDANADCLVLANTLKILMLFLRTPFFVLRYMLSKELKMKPV